MILNSPYITGSITVTGNANVQGTLTVTGSLSGTATSASLALNSNLLQGTGSVGFSTTASLLAVSSSQQQISASLLNVIANYATTGSNSFRANQSITGSLVVSSTITAQTLVVQTVTSSIVYSSGSNIFGSALTDRQTFTGSLNVTGSTHAIFGNVGIGTSISIFNINPTSKGLDITNASNFGSLTLHGNGTQEVSLAGGGNASGLYVDVAGDATATNNIVVFRTAGTNSSYTVTERMRITSASVLIGSTTAAGAEKFGVTKDDGVTDGLHIIADFNKAGSSSAELILGYYASGSAVTGPIVYAANSQPLLFGAGSVERMRLDANGNLSLTAISPKNPDAYDSNRTFVTVQAKTGGVDRGAFMNLVGTAGGSPNYWLGRYGFGATTSTYLHAAITSLTDAGGSYSGCLSFTTNVNASTGDATEKMRITSAGHIGINTSSPVSTNLTGSLTIYKYYNSDQASVPSTTAQAYYSNQHSLYLFGRNSGLTIVSANSEEGSIKFGNGSTTAYATIGTLTGTSAVGSDMYFRVGSDTERMRITAGGNIGIGTTNPSMGTLQIAGTVYARYDGNGSAVVNAINQSAAGSRCYYGQKYTNSTDDYYMVFDNNVVNKFLFYGNGGLGNVQANNGNISDIRTKKDIISLESYWNKFKAIEIVKFKYIDQDHDDYNIGLIAQQLEEVAPEFIDSDGWGKNTPMETEVPLKTVYTTDLYHATIKVLQEAMTKIETLEAQNTDLQAQINELKER